VKDWSSQEFLGQQETQTYREGQGETSSNNPTTSHLLEGGEEVEERGDSDRVSHTLEERSSLPRKVPGSRIETDKDPGAVRTEEQGQTVSSKGEGTEICQRVKSNK